MSSPHTLSGDGNPYPADSGLRCPTCEYNLTGVAENRCPECGKPFDPDKLRAILAGAPEPIPIWDDKQRNIVWRFVLMCLLTWFLPSRLASTFPRRYHKQSVRRFRYAALAVAVCPVFLIVVLELSRGTVPSVRHGWAFVACGLAIWAGVTVCESLLGSVFVTSLFVTSLTPREPAEPCADPNADYCWYGLVGFFRTFTILSVGLACLSLSPYTRQRMPMAEDFHLVVLCVTLWWWLALSVAIARYPAPLGVRIACIWLIPCVAALSVFLGGIVGVMLLIPVLR